MRTGIVFPQLEFPIEPSAVRDFAQAADELGFSHLLVFDHVLSPQQTDRDPELWGPYDEHDSFREPLTLISFWAGVTERVAFVTGVVVAPQRQTALLAKQAADVDLLSGGRLRLGIGVGWDWVEYQALGAEWRDRGARQEEQVEVMRTLWSEPLADYSGRWHRIDRAALVPRPHRPVPIWFGGTSEVARERAARLGDGFLFARTNLPRSASASSFQIETAARLRDRVMQQGRDPGSFGIEGRVVLADGEKTWTRELEDFADAGFDYCAVDLMRAGLRSVDDFVGALRRIAAVTTT